MTDDRQFDAPASLPNQETLPPDPSLFRARVRLQNDPIVNFRSYFLTESDLKHEDPNYTETNPPLALRIEGLNLEISTAHFIQEQALLDTPAETAYKLMREHPQSSNYYFSIIADVRDNNMPLPKSQYERDSYVPHKMRVSMDEEQGLVINCDTLTPEQVNFCLELMVKTLDFTLSRVGKGRIQPGHDYVGRNEDQIIFDNNFLTASNADLQKDLANQSDREKYAMRRDVKVDQLKDFRRYLRDLLDKRTKSKPKTFDEAIQYFSEVKFFDDARDNEPLHRKFLLLGPADEKGLRTIVPIYDPETIQLLRPDVQAKVRFWLDESDMEKQNWKAIVGSLNGNGQVNSSRIGYNVIQIVDVNHMIIIPDPKVEDQQSDIEGKMIEGKNIADLRKYGIKEVQILKQVKDEWQAVEDNKLD